MTITPHTHSDTVVGNPFTLGQARAHLSSGRLGSRISWVQAEPLQFIASTEETYDVAVLVHCLWYFSSPGLIAETLRALSKKATRIYIAEWSLTASSPAAVPHVLAALTQASLECRKPTSKSNVRTVVSPNSIQAMAVSVGLELLHEISFAPRDMLDGKWEVGAVREPAFVDEIDTHVKDEREKAVVLALRDSMLASLEKVPDGVQSMDVWCAVFGVETPRST